MHRSGLQKMYILQANSARRCLQTIKCQRKNFYLEYVTQDLHSLLTLLLGCFYHI